MENPMTTGKTTTLTFRIEPRLKEALRTAAEQEHRSVANMVTVMIREYCARVGVGIDDAVEGHKSAVGRRPRPKRK
jgi:hypothetical protein